MFVVHVCVGGRKSWLNKIQAEESCEFFSIFDDSFFSGWRIFCWSHATTSRKNKNHFSSSFISEVARPHSRTFASNLAPTNFSGKLRRPRLRGVNVANPVAPTLSGCPGPWKGLGDTTSACWWPLQSGYLNGSHCWLSLKEVEFSCRSTRVNVLRVAGSNHCAGNIFMVSNFCSRQLLTTFGFFKPDPTNQKRPGGQSKNIFSLNLIKTLLSRSPFPFNVPKPLKQKSSGSLGAICH